MDWKHFKSGTDIRGIACETEGKAVDLTDEAVGQMAAAFIVWLSDRLQKPAKELTVSVGRDSRLSGPRLQDAVTAARTAAGVTVRCCGLCSTPAMFMTTVDLACDGAVQLTASHHPWYRNGLKFFTREGGLEGEDINAILELCAQGARSPKAAGRVKKTDYLSAYAARLRRLICEEVSAADYE